MNWERERGEGRGERGEGRGERGEGRGERGEGRGERGEGRGERGEGRGERGEGRGERGEGRGERGEGRGERGEGRSLNYDWPTATQWQKKLPHSASEIKSDLITSQLTKKGENSHSQDLESSCKLEQNIAK